MCILNLNNVNCLVFCPLSCSCKSIIQFCLLGGSCRRKAICFYYGICIIIWMSLNYCTSCCSCRGSGGLYRAAVYKPGGSLGMRLSRMWWKVVSELSSISTQSWAGDSGLGGIFEGERVAGLSCWHCWKVRSGCKRKECKIWTWDGEMELRALWLIKSWMLWDDQTVIAKLKVILWASGIKRAAVANTFRQAGQPCKWGLVVLRGRL
jgi:hypothetical protein